MPDATPEPLPITHRFIDEGGDTTFYGKGKKIILGREGISLVFGMGIVKFGRPLAEVRSEIVAWQQQVERDPFIAQYHSQRRQARCQRRLLLPRVQGFG